jgi:hypothetical protein
MPKNPPNINPDDTSDAKYIEVKPKVKQSVKTKLRNKLFISNLIENDFNSTKAAMATYPNQSYNSARSTGSQLLANPNIQEALQIEAEYWLNPDAKTKTVDEIGKLAYSDDRKIMTHKVKCLELMTKIQNLQIDKIEKRVTNLNIDIDLSKLSPEELQKMIVDGLRARIGKE